MSTSIAALGHLSRFHGIRGEDLQAHTPAYNLTADNLAKIAHLQMRSLLIDRDPAASDGHEDTMFDIVDIDTLRWRVSLGYREVFLSE